MPEPETVGAIHQAIVSRDAYKGGERELLRSMARFLKEQEESRRDIIGVL